MTAWTAYSHVEEREAELYRQLDNLEGLHDNPEYERRVKEIREELKDLHLLFAIEFF